MDALAIAGAGTSTEGAIGLAELANATEVGSSTASSSAGGPLVLSNKFATTTPGSSCTTGGWRCIVATINGKIDQTWFDLTQHLYNHF